MKRIIFIISLIVCSVIVEAQTIAIHLPQHSDQKLTITVRNGISNDTIFCDTLDNNGISKMSVPEPYNNYRGMASLSIGDYTIFDFIIAGEDLTLTCEEEYPHGGNVSFINSPENESLQKWFYEEYTRQEKIAALAVLLDLYTETETLHSLVDIEKKQLDRQQQQFEGMLIESELYSAHFLNLRSFVGNRVNNLSVASEEQMMSVRNFVRDSLDINSLYTSGLWFDVLNGILPIYDKGTSFHTEYMTDMALLLDRADNDKIYTTLAENIFSICQSTGWHKQEIQLATYLINGRQISEPTGKLKNLFSLFKLRNGSRAPILAQGKLKNKKNILVFYDSTCNSCSEQMKKLVDRYSDFSEKGYEVISVSADSDKQTFESAAEKYPWSQQLCDYNSFRGTNFLNYGVVGTPTLFVIEKGMVRGIYTQVDDIKL